MRKLTKKILAIVLYLSLLTNLCIRVVSFASEYGNPLYEDNVGIANFYDSDDANYEEFDIETETFTFKGSACKLLDEDDIPGVFTFQISGSINDKIKKINVEVNEKLKAKYDVLNDVYIVCRIISPIKTLALFVPEVLFDKEVKLEGRLILVAGTSSDPCKVGADLYFPREFESLFFVERIENDGDMIGY